jgi:hypothetical protein
MNAVKTYFFPSKTAPLMYGQMCNVSEFSMGVSDLPEATETQSWRTCDVCKIAPNWWNREPRNSLRDNVNWNNGQTDDVAKPSEDASNVMCDLPYCEWRGVQWEGDYGNWGCAAYIFCTLDPCGLNREVITSTFERDNSVCQDVGDSHCPPRKCCAVDR